MPPDTLKVIGFQELVPHDYCNGLVQSTDLATDLRGFVGTVVPQDGSGITGSVVLVRGRAMVGDGLGGHFYWNAVSTATDDGATVIKPTAVAGAGRWLALPTNSGGDVTWPLVSPVVDGTPSINSTADATSGFEFNADGEPGFTLYGSEHAALLGSAGMLNGDSGLNSGFEVGGNTSSAIAVSPSSGGGIVEIDAMGNTANLWFAQANGTRASKTATLSGNAIGATIYYGYQASGGYPWVETATVYVKAAENFDGSHAASTYTIETTDTGSQTMSPRFHVSGDGEITLTPASSAPLMRLGQGAGVLGALDGFPGVEVTGPGSNTSRLAVSTSTVGGAVFELDAFSAIGGTAAAVLYVTGRGSRSAPTALMSGDRIGLIDFSAFVDGTDVRSAASITATAAENFSLSTYAATLAFKTTALDETHLDRLVVDANGYVISKNGALGIATPSAEPATPSTGWLFYVDSGDGNKLKAKASTGTVVTLGTP